MSKDKREPHDYLLALIKNSVKPSAKEEKEEGPDCSKWVARVNQGWDVALKALEEPGSGWLNEAGPDYIDPPLDFEEFYLATSVFTQPKWVLASKDLSYERADLLTQLKKIVFLVEKCIEDGEITYSQDTNLIRSWPNYLIIAAFQVGRVLSHEPTLRRLAGYSLKDGPRDATAERRKAVAALWPVRYEQVRTARKRYTANKKDNWREIVKKADPQIPDWLINELPRDSKQEPKPLTGRWLAEDLRSTPSAILEDVKALKKSGEL